MLYNEQSPFINEEPADLRKRIIAFFLDFLFIILTHLLIFFLATLIYNNTSICHNKQALLNSNVKECYRLEEESRVYEFNGQGDDKYNSHKSEDEIFYTWVQKHIKLAFNIDSSYFIEQGITSLDKLDPSIEEANYSNDHLGYFFHEFVKNRNSDLKIVELNNRNVDEYYQVEVFSKLAKPYPLVDGGEEAIWVYDNQNYSIPHLTSKAAYHVYSFQKLGSKEANFTLYNKLVRNAYSDVYNNEKELLTNSPGFRLYYDVYLSNYHSMVLDIDTCSILSYLITFSLIYLLPTLVTKNHVTLGKKIVHLMIVDIDGFKINRKQYLLRTLLKFFPFFGFTLVSNMLCQGLNSAWMRPMFYMGSFGVSLLYINLLFIIISLISFIILLINHSHCSISDLTLKTYVIEEVDPTEKSLFYKEHEKNVERSKKYVER